MMNVAQRSFIVFISRFASSIFGALATIYFARTLGPSILGLYYLVVAVASWLKIASGVGLKTAITKRISEGSEKSSYAVAGAVLLAVSFSVVSLGVVLFREQVNQYIGEPIYPYVIILLFSHVVYMYVGAVIKGENLVHFDGPLRFINTVSRVGVQLIFVSLGLGAIGLVLGETAGLLFISIIGIVLMLTYFDRSVHLEFPDKKHFSSLLDFAKFSWLNDVSNKTYNLMDTVVLGFFVSNSLIGIYSICWNVSAILTLFSKSVLSVLFPEMSRLSSQGDKSKVSSHIEDALSYTGLLIIPGFVGAIVLGEGILNIYGTEFRRGHTILVILVGAGLVQSYYVQLLNGMDALDRPELSFRVNALFVVSNVTLNFGLVYLFSWTGAALATFLSTSLSMLVSYRYLSGILDFSFPHKQIVPQVVSGVLMGAAVLLFKTGLSSLGINSQRAIPVLLSVAVGACVYFILLLVTSHRFRDTVVNNLLSNRIFG